MLHEGRRHSSRFDGRKGKGTVCLSVSGWVEVFFAHTDLRNFASSRSSCAQSSCGCPHRYAAIAVLSRPINLDLLIVLSCVCPRSAVMMMCQIKSKSVRIEVTRLCPVIIDHKECQFHVTMSESFVNAL